MRISRWAVRSWRGILRIGDLTSTWEMLWMSTVLFGNPSDQEGMELGCQRMKGFA